MMWGLAAADVGRTYSADEVTAMVTRRAAMADREHGQEELRAHWDGMIRQAIGDGMHDASSDDYTEALQRARGKRPGEDRVKAGANRNERADLTEQINAAIERSGQEDESAAFLLEAYRRLQSQNAEKWEASSPGQIGADPETAATAEDRRRLLDEVLDEVEEQRRDVLDRLGREDGPPAS